MRVSANLWGLSAARWKTTTWWIPASYIVGTVFSRCNYGTGKHQYNKLGFPMWVVCNWISPNFNLVQGLNCFSFDRNRFSTQTEGFAMTRRSVKLETLTFTFSGLKNKNKLKSKFQVKKQTKRDKCNFFFLRKRKRNKFCENYFYAKKKIR